MMTTVIVPILAGVITGLILAEFIIHCIEVRRLSHQGGEQRAELDRLLRTLYDLEDDVRDSRYAIAELRALLTVRTVYHDGFDDDLDEIDHLFADAYADDAEDLYIDLDLFNDQGDPQRRDRLPEGGDA